MFPDDLLARAERRLAAAQREVGELHLALAESKRQHAKDVEDAENCIAEMRDDVAGAIQSAAEVHTLRAKVVELQATIRRIDLIAQEASGTFMRFPQ